MDNAPNPSIELHTKLIKLPSIIGLLASTIKAGKWAVIKASWKPQEKKPKKSMIYVGSFIASLRASESFSSFCFILFFVLVFKIGTIMIVNKLIIANISKTLDQGIIDNKTAAKGGPITWPAEPAAVVIPNARDLFSFEDALPTTAKIGPKPLPAIPNPITTFNHWWASGDEDVLLINTPRAYNKRPNVIALRSPYFSANALKIGVPIPQAKFWIAIARENSDRAHKNSSAMGIWKRSQNF